MQTEQGSIEDIVASYGEKLLRYATSILYSHQDAEDIVQDALIAYHQKSNKLEISNISAWLYKVTYNLCLDKIKAKKRRRLSFFEDIKQEPAVYMEDTLSMPEMMKALEALSPADRALLYGRIIDGQSYKELSRIMGISEPNLRKQYERAKNKAAKLLNASGYGLVDTSYVPNV